MYIFTLACNSDLNYTDKEMIETRPGDPEGVKESSLGWENDPRGCPKQGLYFSATWMIYLNVST